MSSNNDKAKYKAAVIGCGKIASDYDRLAGGAWTMTHAGAYSMCPSTELGCAADTNSEALARFGKRWRMDGLYLDYREMLEQESPEVVSICVPTERHFEVFRQTCEYGAKAIFLEKPVASNLEQAWAIRDLAGPRPVAVNYFRRWNPTLGKLKQELEQGLYGRAIRVTVHYIKGLVGNASHFVDLFRWLFGEPERVQTFRVYERPDEEVAADFELRFPGGLIATFLHVHAPDYVFLDVDILLERARIVIAQRGQKLIRFDRIEEPHYGLFQILDDQGRTEETEWKNCTLRAIEELVQCVEEGGQPSCDLEDGIRALAICEKILGDRSAWDQGERATYE